MRRLGSLRDFVTPYFPEKIKKRTLYCVDCIIMSCLSEKLWHCDKMISTHKLIIATKYSCLTNKQEQKKKTMALGSSFIHFPRGVD